MGLDRGGESLNIAAVGDKKASGSHSILHVINVNTKAASAVLTVYNGTSTTGTKVATIDCSSFSPGSLVYDIRCPQGVYAVMTGGNADVTLTVF